jgi:YD repeat-containing protein
MLKFTLAVFLKVKHIYSFIFSKISQKSFAFIRIVAIVLTFALILPVFYFGEFGKAKARTNLPLKQTAPISAPPETYIISNGTNSGTVLPTLTALGTTISSIYSTTAAFISGAETPPGLGAATPPPTFGDRLAGFIAPLFFVPRRTTKETTEKALSEPAPALPASSSVAFDFDGDSRADIGRWQANSFQYKIYNSATEDYTTLNLGSSSSKIAPADFDGDGLFDMTVFSAGSWTVRKSSSNSNWSVTWGTTGDLPVAADYDGDSTADFAIYRPSTNTFWVLTSSSGYTSYTSTALGSSGDIVVPGDFNGDAIADCAVFRPSNGHWFYQLGCSGSVTEIAWGVSTDIPAPGDFDADGTTDITVFRPSTGTWYVLKSSGGSPNYFQTNWGNLGDQPVPADYDGDAITDLAIYRPTTGTWWILRSSDAKPDILNLGTSSDMAVPSAYLKQSGAELYPDQLSPARLAPINETGGTNYYSRNSAWGTSLVSLPGRSGLNLNIGIGYNSLVWTKVGSVMAFDMDHSNVAPGFNFGFPRIEPAYVSSQTSTLSYLMVAPSGSRTEFRQTAASDVYETADSSYAQVKVNNPTDSANNPTPIEELTLTVTGTDGTQMAYSWIGNTYRCTRIKDRNGNYIDITNDSDGRLISVKDTLERIVTVNYDSYDRPSSITQNWQTDNGHSSTTTTHTWASFTYTTKTISTSFYNLSVFGPANNTSISVLDKVTYADGSYTKFEYNGYAQVYKVSNYAYNTDLLNYVWRNIDSPSSNQTDCPRFTQTKTKVAHFNNDGEVTVNNTFTTGVSYTPPGGSATTGTKIEIKTPDSIGTADALVTKIYSPSSGWAESFPVLTEDYATESSMLTQKRWSWTNYTQEDTGLAYIKNPRVTETKIGDDSNTKRTKIYYLMQSGSSTVTQYGLVNAVEAYDSNQTAVLKTQTTSYNLSSNYTSRRIIGLPSETDLYEGTTSGTLVSKMTYAFDEGGYSGTGQSVTATQHDPNYGTSFGYRGNPTSTTRCDATSPTTCSNAVTSGVIFNIAGSPISQTDPRGRISSFSYTDSWNDTVSRSATYAYPTTITDSGGFSSTVKYRYDMGANVWARSPTPSGSGNTYGKTTSRTYDDTIGRVIKEKIENSGAYTRYDYLPGGVSLNTYTTIINADGNGVDSSDEVLTETLFDGAGRVRKTRTENPNSTGGFTGKLVEYNILGQVKRATVPTEMDSSYDPAGDDSVLLWNSREYDWKGRVTKEINTDNTDRLYSYEGCGCAGNQITTIKGEVTTATDVSGTQQTTKRRTQKIYADILGRTVKTEIWDLDGGGFAPYSTVVNTFNGRDQITNVREYSGSDSSTTYQDTTMTFDGHGRLITRHRPEEFDSNNNNALTQTTFTYHTDDTIASVTDPRSAVTNYLYSYYDDSSSSDHRPLLTKITYSVPSGSGIIDPADVSLTYDSAGNRTYMSDGTGNLSYSYDELSRLKEETKNFADTLANAPSGGYKLKYNYYLTGGIKSIEDPFGAIVSYDVDKTGRTTAIGGSGYYEPETNNEITFYVSDISYRAFGGVKSMTYSTERETNVSLSYDTRLRPETYTAQSDANSEDIQNLAYSYFNDGGIKEAVNSVQSNYSQYYDYDFAGRLKRNDFGGSGSGQPFKQTLGYDAFNNLTSRNTATWGTNRNFTAGYANNRKTSGGYQAGVNYYDVAGNIIQSVINASTDNRRWKFDAAGRMTDWEEAGQYATTIMDQGALITFDGDGRAAKTLKRTRNRANGNTTFSYMSEYDIYSSVTGQRITNLTNTGAKLRTYVYLGNTVIAEQWLRVLFKFNAPVTGSEMQSELSGELSADGFGRNDHAALGISVPPVSGGEEATMPDYTKGGHTGNPESRCQVNSAPTSCSQMWSLYYRLTGNIFATEITGYSVTRSKVWLVRGPIPEDTLNSALGISHLIAERGQFVGWLYEVNVLFSVMNISGNFQSQTGVRASLDAKDQRRYDKERRKLLAKLDKNAEEEKCKALLEKVGGLEKVLAAINMQRPFDGENSTISSFDAGIVNEGNLEKAASEENKQAYRNRTIADAFKDWKGAGAVTANYPGGKPGATVSDRSDVYFRPDRHFGFYGDASGLNQLGIWHEALHSSTGKNDGELYTLLTGKTLTANDDASKGINTALLNSGCLK